MPPYDIGTEREEAVIASFVEEIIGTPTSSASAIIAGAARLPEYPSDARQFNIHVANTHEHRESASLLVDKMYTWRGYGRTSLRNRESNRITLVISDQDKRVIGTITVGADSSLGLCADEVYREELGLLRQEGRTLCEYNGLAIEAHVRSKRVLASLFHIAYLYPHAVLGCTDGVLEINPRHERFYERMLGFSRVGPERICPRVGAPSVLLRTDFSYMTQQIEKLGGLMSGAGVEKSLYPYFFSSMDAVTILKRLKSLTGQNQST
jgi:hypothetical protein